MSEDFFAAWDSMQSKTYQLTELECQIADSWGKHLHEESLKQGKKDAHGFRGDGLLIHQQGARGEFAAAKALGIKIEQRVNEYKQGKPDLGENVEVRTKMGDGKMILRPGDHADRNYVSVVPAGISVNGLHSKFIVKGWIKGCDGMKQEYLGSPDPTRKPCFNVPDNVLRPIEELKNEYLHNK